MDSIKFDAVWVIHCVEDEDRLKNIEYQKENNQWLKDKPNILSNANKMWLIDLSNSTDTRLV